ncbi:glycosyltransferase [Herbaspirillum autotrophicum]|uniref:glycosyltransferase n=1 Tax=Herbaspirillum autotrophicum TaxID=180195 RepID=UPI00067CEBE5|nr:glycosyltransferase [Herbaspirillum autotrophicum]
MGLAPIALFVYNRPEHTRKTIAALKKNVLADASDLIIFSDAPKTPQSDSSVQEVRAILESIEGFKSVKIIKRDKNWGLSKSIIDGVSRVCSDYGKVIALEDDLVTSPYFLKFMNDGLDYYETETRVISVHGYIYPVSENLPATFFLRGADCWGWATWKRGWDFFESDSKALYKALHAGGEIKTFDFGGNYDYAHMLKQQIEGKVNSWAIRWYASAFLANKLTLYPGVSLVQNIGNDNSGTHCGDTDVFTGKLAEQLVQVGDIPVVPSKLAYEAVSRYFKSLRLSLMARVRNKISLLRRWWML